MDERPHSVLKRDEDQRLSICIHGAVQGVGFRPFVYRLARELGVRGWVANSPEGVLIEAECSAGTLEEFLSRIAKDKPELSSIQSIEHAIIDPCGYREFEIRRSSHNGSTSAFVMPDLATCPECLKEIFTPSERRYLYPFTNCTNCGPRFTIVESLPYDRSSTSMKHFQMCDDCRRQYEDPLDRRFHAQPIACPACGPHLELWTPAGEVVSTHGTALEEAAQHIRNGSIVAIKGLGGFHLVVDGRNGDSVARLRLRKLREEKPLALMFPSIHSIRKECEVSSLEERVLCSTASPIVLLRRRRDLADSAIPPIVAPRNPYLGAMLPSTPLHHILLNMLDFPIVATSGNLTDEPICTDERDALRRLSGIADVFLVHDRPILRHMDDSVVRIISGRDLVIRRARGYAPLPLQLERPASASHKKSPTVLAVGGQLKNTIALKLTNCVYTSQHIGDLETNEAFDAFKRVIRSFETIYGARPEIVACDVHPRYLSTDFADTIGCEKMEIQHHHAHIAACMAENRLKGRVLGVAWDGSGYGTDGTVWGGEFLLCDEREFRRVAAFRPFPLVGGEKAVREPRRVALGMLHEIFGERIFDHDDLLRTTGWSEEDLILLRHMLRTRINSPLTSSAGRLFDAVSSIIGLRHRSTFEGQAAMEMEYLADAGSSGDHYPFSCTSNGSMDVVDWEPMVHSIIGDRSRHVLNEEISARFHNTLAEMILEVSKRTGEPRVVLSGGCFQNKCLTELTIGRLRASGFRPYWHQRYPPNDGGLSVGQCLIAASRVEDRQSNEQLLQSTTVISS